MSIGCRFLCFSIYVVYFANVVFRIMQFINHEKSTDITVLFICFGPLTPKKRTALIAVNLPLDDICSLKNISLKVEFS